MWEGNQLARRTPGLRCQQGTDTRTQHPASGKPPKPSAGHELEAKEGEWDPGEDWSTGCLDRREGMF